MPQYRASEILQRAKSIENLILLGERHNKFLPGYLDFTDSMKVRLNEARDLVVKKDLDAADNQIRALFDEWRQVSEKYSEEPFGSEEGYSLDEIKRIEYRKKLEQISGFVNTFYNAGFDSHSQEFLTMIEDAYGLVDYGNWDDAEKKRPCSQRQASGQGGFGKPTVSAPSPVIQRDQRISHQRNILQNR